MINTIVLRDPKELENLYPFSVLHPSYEFLCGCLKNYERWKLLLPDITFAYESEELLKSSFLERNNIKNPTFNKNVLFIDGNIIPDFSLIEEIKFIISANHSKDISFSCKNKIVAEYKQFSDKESEKINVEIQLKTVNYIWEIIDLNGKQINYDLLLIRERLQQIKNITNPFFGTHLIGNEIYIGRDVEIMPGAVLDARKGAIIIDDEAKIMANSVIIGPSYIGKKTLIKSVAKIYENCSFGEFCKIGGELEAVVFQGYSNKQHEGFLGHSFVSEWVNFGADTNNSDLKNTYSNIVMRLPGKRVPTDKMFIGLMAGDHTKTAINSQFTTGTTCGIHCNLFHSGFFPSQIPSFTWGGGEGSKIYNFEQAIETAQAMMKRRGKSLNEFEIALMKAEYDKIS